MREGEIGYKEPPYEAAGGPLPKEGEGKGKGEPSHHPTRVDPPQEGPKEEPGKEVNERGTEALPHHFSLEGEDASLLQHHLVDLLHILLALRLPQFRLPGSHLLPYPPHLFPIHHPPREEGDEEGKEEGDEEHQKGGMPVGEGNLQPHLRNPLLQHGTQGEDAPFRRFGEEVFKGFEDLVVQFGIEVLQY